MNQSESTELVIDQQTDDLAKQLAAPLIKAFAKKKKRFASQNREAHNRMNRPHKLEAIERGGEKIVALLDRFKV